MEAISSPPPTWADEMTLTGLRGLLVGEDVKTSALRDCDRLLCRYSPCVCCLGVVVGCEVALGEVLFEDSSFWLNCRGGLAGGLGGGPLSRRVTSDWDLDLSNKYTRTIS